MENKKEIITYSELHGFMFNTGRLSINQPLLDEVIAQKTIDQAEKRELIQTYYISEIIKNDFLTEKTNYGDLCINFDKNLNVIDSYIPVILNKLNHQVSLEEFKHATDIMKNLCSMNESEVTIAENLIDKPFKKLIGLAVDKSHKI